MAQTDKNADELTFEKALAELERLVGQLEEGDLGLSDSLERYEQGVRRLRHCYDLLERAERKIETLSMVDPQGRPVTEPFDDQATHEEPNSSQKKAKKSGTKKSRPAGRLKQPGAETNPDVDEARGLF